jgi:hypothetical protein
MYKEGKAMVNMAKMTTLRFLIQSEIKPPMIPP